MKSGLTFAETRAVFVDSPKAFAADLDMMKSGFDLLREELNLTVQQAAKVTHEFSTIVAASWKPLLNEIRHMS